MRPTSSTILLVENDSREVRRLAYGFARAGHTGPLEFIGDGEEVVRYLRGDPPYDDPGLYPTPGLVIVDLDLDRGSGFQVLRWIQSSSRLAGLPSIVLASSRQPDDVRRAYALGASDYLVRPPSMAEFCDTIRGIVKVWATLDHGDTLPDASKSARP